jgi:hypothetical protein
VVARLLPAGWCLWQRWLVAVLAGGVPESQCPWLWRVLLAVAWAGGRVGGRAGGAGLTPPGVCRLPPPCRLLIGALDSGAQPALAQYAIHNHHNHRHLLDGPGPHTYQDPRGRGTWNCWRLASGSGSGRRPASWCGSPVSGVCKQISLSVGCPSVCCLVFCPSSSSGGGHGAYGRGQRLEARLRSVKRPSSILLSMAHHFIER